MNNISKMILHGHRHGADGELRIYYSRTADDGNGNYIASIGDWNHDGDWVPWYQDGITPIQAEGGTPWIAMKYLDNLIDNNPEWLED